MQKNSWVNDSLIPRDLAHALERITISNQDNISGVLEGLNIQGERVNQTQNSKQKAALFERPGLSNPETLKR